MVWCIEIQETEHLEEALNIIFYLNNDCKQRFNWPLRLEPSEGRPMALSDSCRSVRLRGVISMIFSLLLSSLSFKKC